MNNQSQLKPMKVRYFYYNDGLNRVYYNLETKKFENGLIKDSPKDYSYMLRDNNVTKKGMEKYRNDFYKWLAQLKNSDHLSIRYNKYVNDYVALKMTFKRLSNNELREKLEGKMSYEEIKLIQQCNNGGHTYLNTECTDKYTQCYGYDYSGFYPWLLSLKQLKIPYGKPTRRILEDIKDIEFSVPGFYRINIECSNDNIYKVFQYSKDRVYTHTSVRQIMFLYKDMPKVFKKEDIKVSLIQDNKPNAYVYYEYATGDDIFGEWYKYMSELKNEYPTNKLVKWLSSTLWGYLSKYKYKYVTDDELLLNYSEEEIKVLSTGILTNVNGEVEYKMINKDDPGNRFVILRSFLTSLGREYLANAIYKFDPELKNIVRCYVDDIVLKQPIKKIPNTKKYKLLKPEQKTTGKILFKSRGRYYNKTEDIWAGQWSEKAKQELLL